jgi:hypothetical protein
MSDRKAIPVDWKSLFDGSINEAEFFIPGIAPMGAVTYIYGAAKQGKSLFVLNAALNVCQGKSFLGQPCVKRRVAYLDFENSLEIHVKPRVEEMGFDPGFEREAESLSNLVYFSRQWFDDFDSIAGGQQLFDLMKDHACEAIIIDTSMRRLKGANDSFDTLNAFYRFTLERLADAGYAVVLIEHNGKTTSRGMIGSSQKSAIADCVWEYEKISGTYKLTLDVSRHPVSEDVIEFALYKNPLRYELLETGLSNIAKCALYLVAVDAPPDMTHKKAGEILRKNGYEIGSDSMREVLEMRRKRPQGFLNENQRHPERRMYRESFGDDIDETDPDDGFYWAS